MSMCAFVVLYYKTCTQSNFQGQEKREEANEGMEREMRSFWMLLLLLLFEGMLTKTKIVSGGKMA